MFAIALNSTKLLAYNSQHPSPAVRPLAILQTSNTTFAPRAPSLTPMQACQSQFRLKAQPHDHDVATNSGTDSSSDQGFCLEKHEESLINSLQTLMSKDTSKESKTAAFNTINELASRAVGIGKKAVPGIAISAPLITLAALFTSLHYGKNIIGPKDVYMQTLIGYFTYGFDRLLDAMEAVEDPDRSKRKQQLYDTIKANKTAVIASLTASFALSLRELATTPETLPFIPILLSTLAYKDIKTNAETAKPFYIATLWTMCTTVLPSVMHEKNWDILASPQHLLPATLLMFGSTNLADALDIEEDRAKGIMTLPVKLGKWPSLFMATTALGASLAMIGHQAAELWFKK